MNIETKEIIHEINNALYAVKSALSEFTSPKPDTSLGKTNLRAAIQKLEQVSHALTKKESFHG